MDDRQTQIREGAGLEDSRINKEFLDFLQRWSSPVLTVLAVAALVWAGLQFLERRKVERIDRAFGDYEATIMGGNPSPAALINLADEYEGVRSISGLAKLRAVDLYLRAFVSGVEPGVEIDPMTGRAVVETDELDETQRGVYLDEATRLAREVVDSFEGDPDRALMVTNAMIRLGACFEGKRDFDGARGWYERARDTARGAGLDALSVFAQTRADQIGTFDTALALPSDDVVSALPGEEGLGDEMIPEIPDLDDEGVEGVPEIGVGEADLGEDEAVGSDESGVEESP